MTKSNIMRMNRFTDLLGEVEEKLGEEKMNDLLEVFMDICDAYEFAVLKVESLEAQVDDLKRNKR